MIWREVFLQAALRALRKMYFEVGSSALDYGPISNSDLENLNQPGGILADSEERVIGSIYEEIKSRNLSRPINLELEDRSYTIAREVKVKFPDTIGADGSVIEKGGNKFIDIVFKRQEERSQSGIPTVPSLIEAKRFRRDSVDQKTGKLTKSVGIFSEIDADIRKLRKLRMSNRKQRFEVNGSIYNDFFTYLLVWGDGDSDFRVADEFVARLDERHHISNYVVKSFPTHWDNGEPPSIKAFCWIGLFEIN